MGGLLEGRVAIVTGGGKGIGAGISKALAAEGAKVVFNYNSNPELAGRTLNYIKERGGEAYTCYTDVQDRKQVEMLIEKAVKLYGGLDILVNNAAWQPNLDIDEYTEEQFDQIMNINLCGYLRCMQVALPYLKRSKCPRIINISSIHAKRPGDFDVAYSMTKSGITMLTREAAIEFIKYGITVNAVLPGAIKIEFKSGVTHPMKWRYVPRKRRYQFVGAGMPEDVANVVVFLASEKSSHINGVCIRVDRGAVLY